MAAKYPIVRTSTGFVRGVSKTTEVGKDYFSFQGIPYIKPPVGELRFKDPQPIEPWTKILDATKEGPTCPNLNILTEPVGFEGDESTGVALNIFTPSLKTWKPLPVFFWIHGGGFVFGSSSTLFYGPDYIVENDVILVSINYRLGVLGFLSLKDPVAGVPGNAGLKDQTVALKWVKENIQHFGGDPNNITIAGESAGGGSVHYHLISDMSEGLFQKAIPQSGVALNPWALTPRPSPNWALILAQKLGYQGAADDDIEILNFLQRQDVKTLVGVSFQLFEREQVLEFSYELMCPFVPTIEPYTSEQCFIPTEPLEMGRNAWSSDVHVIIGGCANEGYLFGNCVLEDRVKRMKENNEYLLPHQLRVTRPIADGKSKGQAIKDFYFKDKEMSVNEVEDFCRYYNDAIFWHGINRVIHQRLNSGGRGKTYLYRLNTETSHENFFAAKLREMGKISHTKGTTHAEDLILMFPTKLDKNSRIMPSQSFYKTHKRFLGAFMKFAQYGDPNDSSFAPLKWTPVVRGQENHCLDMKQDVWEFVKYPGSKTLDLWNSLYPKNQLY